MGLDEAECTILRKDSGALQLRQTKSVAALWVSAMARQSGWETVRPTFFVARQSTAGENGTGASQ